MILTMKEEENKIDQDQGFCIGIKTCSNCEHWIPGNLNLDGNVRYCNILCRLTCSDEVCDEILSVLLCRNRTVEY